jgi:hypothetical protein
MAEMFDDILIRVTFPHVEVREEQYRFKTMTEAAHFIGLLQQGVMVNNIRYIMEDHYLDGDTGNVVVTCITEEEAKRKIEAYQSKMLDNVSPEFADRLSPLFRRGGEGGGSIN